MDEPFYPASDGTNQVATPLPQLPQRIANNIDLNRLLIHQQNGHGRVLNHPELDFAYVNREIILTRTAGNATFSDGQPATAAKRLDWLLSSHHDRRPIIAEIKVGPDMNPFYALIQTLMWAAELVTFNQASRLKRCYQDQFHLPELEGNPGDPPIAVDLYLILCKYDSQDDIRREILEITERLCEHLMTEQAVSSHIRRIACLD